MHEACILTYNLMQSCKAKQVSKLSKHCYYRIIIMILIPGVEGVEWWLKYPKISSPPPLGWLVVHLTRLSYSK